MSGEDKVKKEQSAKVEAEIRQKEKKASSELKFWKIGRQGEIEILQL
jgi:hypothetical protein